MGFFVNASFIQKHDAILNKTVTKLLTILTKYFFHIWTLQATLTKISVTELKFCRHPEVFSEILQNWQQKACNGAFFKKLLKKRLGHRCFPDNFEKFFKNTFFIEPLWWLPILKPLDSQGQCCKSISELVTIFVISTLLVLVGIFVFIFGEHKLSVASWRLL